MNSVVVGENILKSYGENLVLDSVSIDVKEGEFVTIMGPSGSGKSTLMYSLSGMDIIDSGVVSFNGMNISKLKDSELSNTIRREMGFIFQQPTLLKNLNIFDNIILPSMRDKKKDVKKIKERARELMTRVDINELEGRDITQASGGQLQRAGICRALMNSPKIIFADEPTGALNSKTANEIMDIICEINSKGTAILLVTHDARVAARSRRVLFMNDGNIVHETTLPQYQKEELEERVTLISSIMHDLGI